MSPTHQEERYLRLDSGERLLVSGLFWKEQLEMVQPS